MQYLSIDYKSITSELCEIQKKYNLEYPFEKRKENQYTFFYDGLFRNKKNEKWKIAYFTENDMSLGIWKEYFTNSTISIFDQKITSIEQVCLSNHLEYDLILVDSNYDIKELVNLLDNFQSLLKPGGMIILENMKEENTKSSFILEPFLHYFQQSICLQINHDIYTTRDIFVNPLYILVKNGSSSIFQSSHKITIISPSYRPQNLRKVYDSINFNYVNEWIIVYDGNRMTENPNIFVNDNNAKIKEYIFKGDGISGNPQRNFALTKITQENTYLYYLDDDNIIHPDLYVFLNYIEDNKIYSFNQMNRIKGNRINVCEIDTAMVLMDYSLCKGIQWIPDKYEADGYYMKDCYEQNQTSHIYINNDLCYYNFIHS
jgi:hypothetical protein